MQASVYLRKLHLHVGKYMQKAHYGIPQSAVSQTLLVPNTRALNEDKLER